MKRFFIHIPTVALAITALLITAGCNTVEGAGEDIEDAGSGIQDAAE